MDSTSDQTCGEWWRDAFARFDSLRPDPQPSVDDLRRWVSFLESTLARARVDYINAVRSKP